MTLDSQTELQRAAEHVEKAAMTTERMRSLFTSSDPVTQGRLKAMSQLVEAHLGQAMEIIERQIVVIGDDEEAHSLQNWDFAPEGYERALRRQKPIQTLLDDNVVQLGFGNAAPTSGGGNAA